MLYPRYNNDNPVIHHMIEEAIIDNYHNYLDLSLTNLMTLEIIGESHGTLILPSHRLTKICIEDGFNCIITCNKYKHVNFSNVIVEWHEGTIYK